tara:strand:- start:476 stop:712 length:237 start_codon:yes stop_codon:yes gene_type:complete
VNYSIYYTTLIFVCVIAYLILTEPNFLKFVDIQFRILSIQIRKYFILIKLYPKLRWELFLIERRSEALKRKLKESTDE